ncbi:hypothetical protein KDH_73600 [Dictyobacter sp. S3.2.2.5]|uniref:Pyrrolo-quinoline quinone repeat domain-containing protein n=1 Tax=Dictyobacter halimunensis TaxID=3026934 RepID=A0ABQ6G620_9CHLR|nr:hypothetical protein KDH_73600 [Dictyobacter sp. S3.2.2.5]
MGDKLPASSQRKTSVVRVRGVFFIVIVACVTVVAGWVITAQGARQAGSANRPISNNRVASHSTIPQDVYVGYKDTVYRLSGQNGSIVWKQALVQPSKMNRISGSSMQVQVMSSNLICVQLENTVFVLDSSSGKQLWQYAVHLTPAQQRETRAYIGSVVFDQQRVYIYLATGELLGFDIQSGKQLWQGPRFPNGVSLSAADGMIYAKSTNAQGHPVLYAVDGTTGSFLWHFQPQMWGNTSFDAPLVADGVVYDAGNPLYALDARTGKQLWEQPLSDRASFFTNLHLLNGRLYADTSAAVASVGTVGKQPTMPALYRVYAFDVQSGKMLWQSQAGDRQLLVDANAIAVLASADKVDSQSLQLLDPVSGALRWQTTLRTPVCDSEHLCGQPPVAHIADGKLVLLDNGGQAYALRVLDLQSGKQLSQYPVSLPFKEGLGESVLSNGRLYVKTGVHGGGQYSSGSSNTFWNYNLYAIDLTGGQTAWHYQIGKLLEYQDPIAPLVLAP